MGIWGGLIYLAFTVAILMVIQWYMKVEGGRHGRSDPLLLDMPDSDAAGGRESSQPSSATRWNGVKPAAKDRFRP